jgi:uncharacterized protein YkwD
MRRLPNRALPLRYWMIWIGLISACGPMYQAPGGPPPGTAPAPAAIAPDPANPPPAEDPAVLEQPAAEAPEPAYAAARPAPPVRPARSPRGASDEAAAWLEAHNRVREQHCAAPLTWSASLAQVAQRWANTLRDKGCAFGHSNGKFGENLAAGTSGTLDPGSVVKMWYDEVAQYRFPDGGFSMKTGHFTQVVWRGTTRVGCGRSRCNDMDIWVCEYDPAGNWEGQYRENVLPRGCRAPR